MNAMVKRTDIELVGVYDADAALRDKFATQHKIDAAKMFADLDRLITTTKPEALVVYTNTFDHLKVIEIAARHGVHVMVEKPLAVSTAHAKAIAAAAQRGKIHVLVNYETTWYRSHRAVWRLMHEEKTGGRIRKIVAMDGHFGPKEIGTQPEFFDWLSDPVRNGAGALYDFGCYGANIATWLLDNERPLRVTAVTQRHKPAIYPKWTTRPPSSSSTPARRRSCRRRGTGPITARTSRCTPRVARRGRRAAPRCGRSCAASRWPTCRSRTGRWTSRTP